MDLGISGKHALVCGASKGLGFGCAQARIQKLHKGGAIGTHRTGFPPLQE